MLSGLGKRRFIGGPLVSLVITLLLSLGAIYGLNRYLVRRPSHRQLASSADKLKPQRRLSHVQYCLRPQVAVSCAGLGGQSKCELWESWR